MTAGLSFFTTVSFCVALTPDEAMAKHGKPLPSEWTAGVFNHGGYYQWWTIQEHPVLFGVSVLLLITSLVFLNTVWAWIPEEWLRETREKDSQTGTGSGCKL